MDNLGLLTSLLFFILITADVHIQIGLINFLLPDFSEIIRC